METINYNLQKLEEWYSFVKVEKKLKLKEAQKLYKKIISTNDALQKKKLQDELIMGTMYVIYDLLKNSYLPYFPNGQLDVEDVISVTSEIWVEFVLSGKLLNISMYSDFVRSIFRKINTRLYENEINYNVYLSIFKLGKQEFYELLTKYLVMRRRFFSFSLQDFLELHLPIEDFSYYLFENIYETLERQGLFENKNISERQLSLLLPNFVEQYIDSTYNFKDQENYICKIQDENGVLQVENQLLQDQILEMIEQGRDSQRNCEIFCKYYGLKEFTSSNYAELAREYQLSRDRTGEIEKRIRRRLKNLEFKNLLEEICND